MTTWMFAWLFASVAHAQSTTWVPAAGEHGSVVYEDNWPDAGDLDFNDAALRIHTRHRQDMSGRTTELVYDVSVHALGARLCSGAALHLPVAPSAMRVERSLSTAGAADGSPWSAPTAVTPEATGDGGAVVPIAGDLRSELCAGQGGFLNTEDGDVAECRSVALRVIFDPALASAPALPGDVFLHRCAQPGHQVHLPQYPGITGGTYDVDTSLFGTGADASSAGSWYVDGDGLPFALHLADNVYAVPRERVRVDTAFPDITLFAAGDPAGDDFWHRPVDGTTWSDGGTPPQRPIRYFDATSSSEHRCLAGGGAWADPYCDCGAHPGGRWDGADCVYDADVQTCQDDPDGTWDLATDACACPSTDDFVSGVGCAEVGTADNPGLSCKEILDRGVDHGDTTYWIDPDGSGAFTATCDMSGGGWTIGAGTFAQGSALEWEGANCTTGGPHDWQAGDVGFDGPIRSTLGHHLIATGNDLLYGQFEISATLSYDWGWATLEVDAVEHFDPATLRHEVWQGEGGCGAVPSVPGRYRLSNNSSNDRINVNWFDGSSRQTAGYTPGRSPSQPFRITRDASDIVRIHHGSTLIHTFADPLPGPLRPTADIQLGASADATYVYDLQVRWLGD